MGQDKIGIFLCWYLLAFIVWNTILVGQSTSAIYNLLA